MTNRVILCFGDSNTHGTAPMKDSDQKDRFDRETRWPRVMASALSDGWDVIEEGLPGRTTVHDDPIEGAWKNGLALLPAILNTHRPIDLVLIMLGTNDLKARFSVTAGDIAASCGKLADEVARSQTGPEGKSPKVLLIAPPRLVKTGAVFECFEGAVPKSMQVAGHLKTEANRRKAAFFDAGSVIDVDQIDGIHLNADAHLTLGGALANEVRKAFS